MIENRTDLALEAREQFPEDDVEIKGVKLTKVRLDKPLAMLTTIEIMDEHGSKCMQKPIGKYITIEAGKMEEEEAVEISSQVAQCIRDLTGDLTGKKILVAGLGNRNTTPDALGPRVLDKIQISRHIIKEFGQDVIPQESVSSIAPGVMAQTGMESVDILLGIVEKTKPDILIVVDALAARSMKRLNTTIQLCDGGISPGSGIGNNRKELNEKTFGIPVIAIGVPTVVDARTIVNDILEETLKGQGYNDQEIESFIKSFGTDELCDMFVTPKDVDEEIETISNIVAEGLNRCFIREEQHA